MSDCVIRFGGSYCNNKEFTAELSKYILKYDGRKFIVVSSFPEIRQKVLYYINDVFDTEINIEAFSRQFEDLFFELTDKKATEHYLKEVNNLALLLNGIHLIGDYSPGLEGQVLSFSEKLTVQILQYQLTAQTDIQVICPEDMGLTVSEDYGNASYTGVDKGKIDSLPVNGVFVIPGSFGITVEGKIARAGETASDYTAAALTSFLGIQKLILWGMEKEFYSADPELVNNPGIIKRLTYSEASELAYFDHYSIHPRIVEPLEKKHIPIHIFSANSHQIETIINTETYISKQIVKSVSYSDDISILQLNGPGVGLKPGILAKVTGSLNNAGINIKSVITAQVSINIILNMENGDKALNLVSTLGFDSVKEIQVIQNVSLIGIIGHGMQHNYGISSKLFNAVAQSKVSVLLNASGYADLVSYIVVRAEDRDVCVSAIYKSFFKNLSNDSELED